ncbi:MAG: HEAT repeat domain-containing protein [Acidimicrobiaceae bacterium]|nr:HEAT repeat domain-containing protein [Acidimicrobiaceae bacterium]
MTRRRAAAMAGHRGDRARARAYLDDDEAAVRAGALRALERAGGLDAGRLAAALEDPAPAVRITALELAASRDDVAVGAAAARLDDPDQRVVEAAAWACGEKVSAVGADPVDPAPVVAALTRVARSHTDPLCRESAVAALGAIAHPDGLAAVLAGLDDRPEVRRRAVIALAPFDGPEVEAALAKAGNDRDKQVRAAVTELRGPAPGPD